MNETSAVPPRSQHVHRFLLIVGALVVIAAEPARAATVSVTVTQGDRFVVTDTTAAGGPEDDQLVATVEGNDLVIRAAGAPLTAGPGCSTIDAQTARCSAATRLHLTGGPGHDRLDLSGLALRSLVADADGGPGDDVLLGAPFADVLVGGPGIDLLVGGSGDDRFFDADAADASADVYDGGDGLDEVRYAGGESLVADLAQHRVTRGATVDALREVEGAHGADGDDVLRGDERANTLSGGGGDDVLEGGAGDDGLYGGTGRDVLRGGDDGDTIQGGGRGSVRDGGPGADRITAGPGRTSGGAGDDAIFVAGRVDAAACGSGRDVIVPSDIPLLLSRDCELVALRGSARLVTPEPTLRRSALRFATQCAVPRCGGVTIDVRVGSTIVARGRTRQAPAATRADVRLTPAGRRLLRRRPRITLTIRFAGTRWRSSVAASAR